jgi:GTPase SAR1 family protein
LIFYLKKHSYSIFLFLAGSEKYRSITTGHYRFALGAVLVYDISNADSFKNCRYWLENIRTYADENVVIALVGNYSL